MRKLAPIALLLFAVLMLAGGILPRFATASSHREAPLISADPQADNTDVYAFVSPDRPDTVTLIANYIPFEEPSGGPYFYNFGEDVLYEIKVSNDNDVNRDISYQFTFRTEIRNPNTFLYNTGPINALDDPDWSYRQLYTVRRLTYKNGKPELVTLGRDLPVPPANIGPRATPNYETLAASAVRDLPGGIKVFAGPRDEPFFIDTGSIFDLAGLRPFNPAHVLPLPAAEGVDGLRGYNVHTIALQIPINALTRNRATPTDPADPNAVIGVYASARRQSMRVLRGDGTVENRGPFVQVSRLANPLINEVIIPTGQKDYWNSQRPQKDAQFEKYYLKPELTTLANILYPAIDNANETNRTDLVTILLTGVTGLNATGAMKGDLMRLNTAIPPSATPSRLGVLEGDLAGFPNGRRPADDVTDIELRALTEGYGPVLNGLLGLPNRTPNNTLGDGVDLNDKPFLTVFPYLATPHQGYEARGRSQPSSTMTPQ